jgi:hypothetical protein
MSANVLLEGPLPSWDKPARSIIIFYASLAFLQYSVHALIALVVTQDWVH